MVWLAAGTVPAGRIKSEIQPRKLIDCHTAGALPKSHYDFDFRFFGRGGIATGIGVGLTDRFSLGISYQVMRLMGQDKVRFQSFPGGLAKYRLIEESYYLPGLALGFDSQGGGEFYTEGEYYPRFYFKSKGFFGALSKSYLLAGHPLGFHAECSYSIVDNQAESETENRNMNVGVGMDLCLNEELSVLAEYDAALDDNDTRDIRYGYLNAAVRWAIFRSFIVELDFKDILENKELAGEYQKTARTVRIVYVGRF
jgi:hypothetical protein